MDNKTQNLQRLRKEAGLSQSQLAKLAGLNVQVLQQYERDGETLKLLKEYDRQ